MNELGSVSVTCRADSPEGAAMGIAEDIDSFLNERALNLDDIKVLHATETKERHAYVHTLVLAYVVQQDTATHNVPSRRLSPDTRRLRPLLWSARELLPQEEMLDRQLVAQLLGCSVNVLSYVNAPMYGVFENQRLTMISATWEAAVATANRANTSETY